MPPTLHKFLIHEADIISSALLPIGQLTEEAQEACNKDFKRYREHNSRKCSRVKSNQDIFHLLLLSSDPILTSKRKQLKNLPKEVIDLLMPPTVNECHPDDGDDDDQDEDSSNYDSDDNQ